jgi:hypothetical protein
MLRWSLYSQDCLYPLIRRGQSVPNDVHLCTLNPGGFIESDDGARIRLDGKGYGLRSPAKYLLSMALTCTTEDARYGWLTRVLGVMEGEFDEKAGRATWRVYVPCLSVFRVECDARVECDVHAVIGGVDRSGESGRTGARE